ncbi:MAG TPA: thioesterase family protein [Stellaceae bacterium]|nr:thioesterase family protein [Stellaceae bacterium]
MAPWTETYRGSVAPWECDVTEHFTIAYYFHRVGLAEAALADRLGLVETLRRGGFVRRYDVRFLRELRAGSAFHIESAALGGADALRLGHRIVDSASGEPTAWVDGHWEGVAAGLPADRLAAWDGPEFEPRGEPAELSRLVPSAAGRVEPGELDEFGRLGLGGFVHSFTNASVQSGARIGLTADFIKTGRRGFSTFELRLRIAGALGAGESFATRSGIVHLGNSSLRFLHVMRAVADGREVARLGQYGVQLDLDARRPAALSPEFRARAQALLIE